MCDLCGNVAFRYAYGPELLSASRLYPPQVKLMSSPVTVSSVGDSHPDPPIRPTYVPTFTSQGLQTALLIPPQSSSPIELDDSHHVENSFPLAEASTCSPQGQFQAPSIQISRPTEQDRAELSPSSSEERKANTFLDDAVGTTFGGETPGAVKNPKPFESSAERNEKSDGIENDNINSPWTGSDSNPEPKSTSLVPPTFKQSLSCPSSPIDKKITFLLDLPKTKPECPSKLQAVPVLQRTLSCPGSGEAAKDASKAVVEGTKEVSEDAPDKAVLPNGPIGIHRNKIEGIVLHSTVRK